MNVFRKVANALSSSVGFSVPKKKTSPYSSVGFPGTAIIQGHINDSEKNRNLIDRKRWETFQNIISNVSVVAAGIAIYLAFLSKAKWTIIPPSDSPQDAELAEFMQDCIETMDTPWSQVIKQMALFKYFGFTIHEWTAKKVEDGRIGLLDIEPRPQFTIEQWDMDDNGKLLGVVQRSPSTMENVYLPRSKIVYCAALVMTDDPRGLGLLRQVAETCNRLEYLMRLEHIGFETDMRGIPVIYAPLGDFKKLIIAGQMTEEQEREEYAKLEKFIKNHARAVDSGMVLPSDPYYSEGDNAAPGEPKFRFELVSGDHYGHAEIGEAINRLQKEVARVFGVEQLLLGESSSGSLALARDKSKNFSDAVNADLEFLTQVVEKDIITPIWNLNGFPEESKPKAVAEKVEQRDIDQISAVLADMSQAGVTLMPEDEAVGEVFDNLGLTRLDTNIERFVAGQAPEGYLGTTYVQDDTDAVDDNNPKNPKTKPKPGRKAPVKPKPKPNGSDRAKR